MPRLCSCGAWRTCAPSALPPCDERQGQGLPMPIALRGLGFLCEEADGLPGTACAPDHRAACGRGRRP